MLLAVAGLALAQQAGSERLAVVLTAANVSPDGGGEAYQRLLTEALSVETANAGFRLVPPARWEQARARLAVPPQELVLGPRALAVAREVGADVVATGFYRIDETRIVFEVKFYDVRQGRIIAASVRSGRTGLGVYNLVNEAVLEVVDRVSKPLEAVPARVVSADAAVRILALSSPDEDAAILIGGRAVATVEEGRALLHAVADAGDLGVEIRKPGFHSRLERVRVPRGATAAALEPLWPETRWAGEALYTSGQLAGAGVGVRSYVVPDKTFLSVDNYFYVQSTFTDNASPVFHDDVRFLVGRYLFLGPYSPFRVGVSAGFGAIATVFSRRDAGDAFDPYLSPLNVWLEWNTRRWSVFWRTEGKYALGAGTGLLDREWLEVQDKGPPMTLGVLYKW